MKWYDFFTLGITWIVRMLKIGKAIYKIYKQADINKDKKISIDEFKRLLRNKEAWNSAMSEIANSLEFKKEEIKEIFKM